MAIVKNNDLTKGLSGKVGNMIFKNYKDKTVVSPMPDMSKVVFSELQKANHALMIEANRYGKKIIADPKRKAQYAKQKGIKLSMAYCIAVQEYFEEHKKK